MMIGKMTTAVCAKRFFSSCGRGVIIAAAILLLTAASAQCEICRPDPENECKYPDDPTSGVGLVGSTTGHTDTTDFPSSSVYSCIDHPEHTSIFWPHIPIPGWPFDLVDIRFSYVALENAAETTCKNLYYCDLTGNWKPCKFSYTNSPEGGAFPPVPHGGSYHGCWTFTCSPGKDRGSQFSPLDSEASIPAE